MNDNLTPPPVTLDNITERVLARSVLPTVPKSQTKSAHQYPRLGQHNPTSEEDWETLVELIDKECLTPLDPKLTQMPPHLFAVNQAKLGEPGPKCLGGMGNLITIQIPQNLKNDEELSRFLYTQLKLKQDAIYEESQAEFKNVANLSFHDFLHHYLDEAKEYLEYGMKTLCEKINAYQEDKRTIETSEVMEELESTYSEYEQVKSEEQQLLNKLGIKDIKNISESLAQTLSYYGDEYDQADCDLIQLAHALLNL